MVQCGSSLGVRLVVGQRTLDPYAEVRILDPQPTSHEKKLRLLFAGVGGG